MPQIAQLAETWSSQIFWLLLVFGLVFFVIGRGMVPRVLDTVEMRDRQIADDLAAAQAARGAADAQEAAWRARQNETRAKVQALVGEARAKAQAGSEARLAEVQARLDARLAEAEARINASREAAAGEIEDVAAEATRAIASRLAAVEVDEAAAREAVRKVMVHG